MSIINICQQDRPAIKGGFIMLFRRNKSIVEIPATKAATGFYPVAARGLRLTTSSGLSTNNGSDAYRLEAGNLVVRNDLELWQGALQETSQQVAELSGNQKHCGQT